jgi:hypothetical protein
MSRSGAKGQGSGGNKVFDDAFEIARALVDLEEEIPQYEALAPANRYATKKLKQLNQLKHRLDTQITPARKEKAIAQKRLFTSEYLKYCGSHDEPQSVTGFIEDLDAREVRNKGPAIKTSDTTVRNVVRKLWGKPGAPGRPRSK